MLTVMNRLFLLVLLGLAPLAVQAGDVYKYVDDRGVVHYTDKPPAGVKKADLPELQTYSSEPSSSTDQYSAGSSSADTGPVLLPPEAAALGFYSSVKITSPAPDETFHTADAQVTVAASVQPGLQSAQGHHLVFYVDGIVRPTDQSSIVLQGVERGSHTVSAAVLDAGGRVLTQSPPVSFHMLPPTVSRSGKH